MKPLQFAAPFLLMASLIGCAQMAMPPAPVASSTGCEQLSSRMGEAASRHSAATKREQDAWKAVIPIAVAAQYAEGNSARREAERDLAALQGRYASLGCAG